MIESVHVQRRVAEALSDHAAAALPEEACGLLIGTRGRDVWRVKRAVRCANIAPRQTRAYRFEIDPAVVIRTRRALRGGSDAIVGFYHSHPDGSAGLSATDLEYARNWPSTLWVVVPVKAGRAADPVVWWLDRPESEPRAVTAVAGQARDD